VESNGFIFVEDLDLATGSLGWAVKWEVAVSISYKFLKVLVHLRASGIAITVVDVHGYK
jgi:hypothetical protein